MTLRVLRLFLFASVLGVIVATTTPAAQAESYQRISGEGSSWAAPAIDAMRVNVKQFGINVDYNGSGSSTGRKNWLNGTADFAASDIPFQFKPEDGSAPEKPQPDSYAYIPVVAGGTSFIYNLKINGQRVTNLRLSGENVAKIFTSVIKKWNDPAIQADNPGLVMPDRPIVPVVRSDGSGSTAQFTLWMIKTQGSIWQDYCQRSGRAPACGFTSYYPTVSGMIAQQGDNGVTGYVTGNYAEGAIGYVNYSYAIGARFPVAKVLNNAGYYTEPTPQNVAVALLKARINYDKNSDDYLTQVLDDVYTDSDPRNYQLSSYSYFILRTKTTAQFNEAKGKTLGAFASYAMCQAQQSSESLGYSPLPINLVSASLDQIKLIPGVEQQSIDIKKCKNPTFSEDGHNVLADTAPQPQGCDKKGTSQCADGTGGAKSIKTAVKSSASSGATGGASNNATTGNRGNGATTGGNGASSGNGATGSSGAAGDSGGDFALGGDDTSDGGNGAGADPEASPTVLAGATGWAESQTLIVVISLLLMALILLPPFAWRWASNRHDDQGAS